MFFFLVRIAAFLSQFVNYFSSMFMALIPFYAEDQIKGVFDNN